VEISGFVREDKILTFFPDDEDKGCSLVFGCFAALPPLEVLELWCGGRWREDEDAFAS
jgi:hypothetical protein